MANINNKISVYVRNKHYTPSSYYRIMQYMEKINGNIKIREFAPDYIYKIKINNANQTFLYKLFISIIYYIVIVYRVTLFLFLDYYRKPKYTIVSKSFCPKLTPFHLLLQIKLLAKRTSLIWDFDDNIFESKEVTKYQAKLLIIYSDYIIVTNEYLKGKISNPYRKKVHILPTTDGDLQGFDVEKIIHSRLHTYNSRINLIWVATRVNMYNLDVIIEELETTAKELVELYEKELFLIIVCNGKYNYNSKHLKIVNITWDRLVAKNEIYKAHIGIMPLVDGEYNRGKGGFKLIQYISTGLPVIASNVGYNNYVVSDNFGFLIDNTYNDSVTSWKSAIIKLSSSTEIWKKYSENAYDRWNNQFSYKKNLIFWKKILE